MSGILRLSNDATGQSTLDTNATTDVTYSLPDTTGDTTALILTDKAHEVSSISWDGIDVTIQNGDINLDNGTLFVDESTNFVGIGTTSPQAKLDIFTVTGPYFRGGSDNTARQLIIESSTTTNPGDTHTLRASSTSGEIAFANSINSELVRIDRSGHLGVGTSSPAIPLDVYGADTNANGLGDVKGQLRVFNDTTAFGSSPRAGIVFSTKYRTSPDIPLDGAAIYGGKENATDANKDFFLAFATRDESPNEAVERMRIDSSGRVGIGTATPNELLEIKNTSGTTASFRIRTQSVNGADGSLVQLSAIASLGTYGTDFTISNRNTSGGAITERFRIDNQGRVGVGNSSPNAKLQVNQDASDQSGAAAIKAIGTAYGTNKAIHSYMDTTNSNKSLLYVENGSGVVMNVAGDGNVGIGTASPDVSLEVSKTVAGEAVVTQLVNRNQSGTSDSVSLQFRMGRTVDSTILRAAKISAIKERQWTSTPSNVNSALAFYTTLNESQTEKVRIDSAGRVLVGTTDSIPFIGSTHAKLQTINTNTQYALGMERATDDISGAVCVFRKTRSTTNGGATVVQSNDDLGYIRFAGTDGTTAVPAVQISAHVDGDPDPNNDGQAENGMPGRLVFSTTAEGASSPTERMRIDNTGNVFVGGSKGYLVAEYSDSISDGENLTITFAGASNSYRSQNIFQITYCNHTNNSSNLFAASFIINIKDTTKTGYTLSMTDFQSIYNVNSTVGAIGDLTFVDNGDGTATLALPNKVGSSGNSGNTIARVTIQRLCSGFGDSMYPTQAVAV